MNNYPSPHMWLKKRISWVNVPTFVNYYEVLFLIFSVKVKKKIIIIMFLTINLDR